MINYVNINICSSLINSYPHRVKQDSEKEAALIEQQKYLENNPIKLTKDNVNESANPG